MQKKNKNKKGILVPPPHPSTNRLPTMHANNVDNVKAGVPNCLAKLFAPLWSKETGRADTDDTNRVITEVKLCFFFFLFPYVSLSEQRRNSTRRRRKKK